MENKILKPTEHMATWQFSSSLLLLIPLSLLSAKGYALCDDRFPENTPTRDFVLSADATVLHSKTNLHWARCSQGQYWKNNSCNGTASLHTFKEAFEQANQANAEHSLGFSDWLLPSIEQLRSLVELHCANPSINESVFPNTPSSWYWSASIFSDFPWYGQPADFGNGNDAIFFKIKYEDTPFPVRLVRIGSTDVKLKLGLDSDQDGLSDLLEKQGGSNTNVKDQDIRQDSKFIAQQYRDLLFREVSETETSPLIKPSMTQAQRLQAIFTLVANPEFQAQQLDLAVLLPLLIDNKIPDRTWINRWREKIQANSSSYTLIDQYMQNSDLKQIYFNSSDSAFISSINQRISARSLTAQALDKAVLQLQNQSRAAYIAQALLAELNQSKTLTQVQVILVADLLANYPLNQQNLDFYTDQLSSGKLSLVQLIQDVVSSPWYLARFISSPN